MAAQLKSIHRHDTNAGTPAEPVGRRWSHLDAAERAFALLASDPAPPAVDGAAIGHGLPRELIGLRDLRDLLLSRRTPAEAREAIWRVLVTNAQIRDASWVLVATGMALPGLRNVARQLAAPFDGDVCDLDAEVLAGFTEMLKSIDPDAGALAGRLIRAAQRAGSRARALEWDYAARRAPARESLAPPRPAGHEDLVLAKAVREGAITEWEANVILATRLDRIHLTDLVREYGCTYRQLHYAREMAERSLAEWLGIGPERATAAVDCESAA